MLDRWRYSQPLFFLHRRKINNILHNYKKTKRQWQTVPHRKADLSNQDNNGMLLKEVANLKCPHDVHVLFWICKQQNSLSFWFPFIAVSFHQEDRPHLVLASLLFRRCFLPMQGPECPMKKNPMPAQF
jgi:hypothetical protein